MSSTRSGRLGISSSEAIHIGIALTLGVSVAMVSLAILLPTRQDVWNAIEFARGRTGRDINGALVNTPLPDLDPRIKVPFVRPAPLGARPLIIGPLPNFPADASASRDAATGKSYSFYMEQLRKAREFESRRRGAANVPPEQP